MNYDILAKALEAPGQRDSLDGVREHSLYDADEFAPLLELAHQLRAIPAPPMPARWQAAETHFLQMAQTRRAARPRHAQESLAAHLAALFSRPLAATLVLLLLFLVLGTGTITASAGALPGAPLYAVKRANERIQLAFTSPTDSPDLLIQYAERRRTEIEVLLQHGNIVPPTLVQDLSKEIEEAQFLLEQRHEQRVESWHELEGLAERALVTLEQFATQGAGDSATIERAEQTIERVEERAHGGSQGAGPPQATPTPSPSATPTPAATARAEEQPQGSPPEQEPTARAHGQGKPTGTPQAGDHKEDAHPENPQQDRGPSRPMPPGQSGQPNMPPGQEKQKPEPADPTPGRMDGPATAPPGQGQSPGTPPGQAKEKSGPPDSPPGHPDQPAARPPNRGGPRHPSPGQQGYQTKQDGRPPDEKGKGKKP
ncbi:MAG: DUF5667 domain-containing protein [Ardenticatenaceae bacterium]|nr:DUF5667 domain-containing protein [Ardenticatenaceae bacterium]